MTTLIVNTNITAGSSVDVDLMGRIVFTVMGLAQSEYLLMMGLGMTKAFICCMLGTSKAFAMVGSSIRALYVIIGCTAACLFGNYIVIRIIVSRSPRLFWNNFVTNNRTVSYVERRNVG